MTLSSGFPVVLGSNVGVEGAVGGGSTVRVKLWNTVVTALLAEKVMLYVPAVPVAGVPLITPVAVLNVTPLGSVPLSPSVGVGKPVAVTVNVPGVPSPNVALLALVMTGTVSTVWM